MILRGQLMILVTLPMISFLDPPIEHTISVAETQQFSAEIAAENESEVDSDDEVERKS